ncbi:MAG: MFS transporter [Acidimicrobiia bacterium]|nr:MAG: MFS transporter [Acidimicrobiia bacterium]
MSTTEVDHSAQRRALVGIAGAQLFALALWFSASAVAPQLEIVWDLSMGEVTWLTLTVQLGFVAGALGIAMSGIADSVPARRLFTVSAIAAAGANAALLLVTPATVPLAFLLRFATGALLAGVYPSGLKVMAGWFRTGRGMALGALVGALTIGSAAPHLVRGLGFGWEGVILVSSALTMIAAGGMAFVVDDGPFEVPVSPFSWAHVRGVVRNRGFRLSTYGYLGHMWELYAMWTWTAAFLAASAVAGGYSTGWVPTATFAIIAIGGIGSYGAGIIADRTGRTGVAGWSMAVSGSCALLTPLLFGLSPLIVVPVFLVWGLTVVSDSAQFSTMVTETVSAELRGTALALQTGLGFLLTLVTIAGVPAIVEQWGWQWAFPWLAIGPVVGVAAMVALRRSSYAVMLAGGRG